MATNNAPKHDFAPAWLKIPTNENTKPPASKQGEIGDDKGIPIAPNRGDWASLSPPSSNGLEYSSLYTRHSFDHYYDGSKRITVGQNSKSRHHSVDDDYYAYNYGAYAYYNGYGYGDKFDAHLGSQPSSVRSPGQRDTKYQHPHARYGTSQNVNYSYYDFLPTYEYYGNEAYYNNYPAGRGSAGKAYGEKEGRSDSKEGKDDKSEDGDIDKPFIDDFPSLNGGLDKTTVTTTGSKQTNGTSGVWDKPRKSGSSKGAVDGETDLIPTKVLRDTNIYKNLVPTKSTIPRRPARMNGSYSKEQGPLWGLKPPTSSSSPPGGNRELTGPPSTPPVDILNTRFVTQPKTLSDKKSNFLKALRQEDEKGTEKKYINKNDGSLMNGIDRLNIEEDASHLSSSLEAEQRLLREMGWNEADEEEYEITEDDKKEFINLAKHVQPPRNGPRSIPKIWSPKHIPVYTPNVNELNDTLSSSDSDSEDGEN